MSRTKTELTASTGLKSVLVQADQGRRKGQARLAKLQTPLTPPRNDLLPHCPIEVWPIERLTMAKRQLRTVSADQVARIGHSIAAFGQVLPILVTQHGEVIDGHSRLEAAKAHGMTKVSCMVVSHLSAEEVRLLRLSINRLAERGAWDIPSLKLELGELICLELPIELSGFDTIEIDQILTLDDVPEQEIVPEPQLVAVSRLGDVWLMGGHRLVCGDALEASTYEALWVAGDPLAKLLLTDEPYNVKIKGHVTSGRHREFAMASGEMTDTDFGAFNRGWMARGLERLAEGALLATFIDWRHLHVVQASAADLGLTPINMIVWAKSNAGQGSLWRSAHELLPVYRKGQASHANRVELGKHGRYRTNVWTYAGASSMGSDARKGLALHPTVKPRVMLQDALLDVTEPGDLVLEPFAGSGSLILAAEAAGRRARAIELDPLYVDVCVRRWQEMTGQDAVLEAAGQTFEAVAATRQADAERGIDDQLGDGPPLRPKAAATKAPTLKTQVRKTREAGVRHDR